MEEWKDEIVEQRNKYLVFLCALVTLWQRKKNATKTLRHKIAQKENEGWNLG